MTKSRRLRAIESQIQRLEKRLGRYKSQSNAFSRWRLIIFFAGIGLGIALYYGVAAWLGWATFGVTFVVFNIVAFFHRRLNRGIHAHQIWQEIKQTQIARMELKWEHIPAPPPTSVDERHPFSIDLDLSGKYSLHHVLDTCVSQHGSHRLLDWLIDPQPEFDRILQRQRLVQELAPMSRFRDKLRLVVRQASPEQLQTDKLIAFLQQAQPENILKKVVLLSAGLAAVNVILFALNQLQIIPAFWIASLLIYGGVYFRYRNLRSTMLDDAVAITDELKKIRGLLIYLETYPYHRNQNLMKLVAPFLERHRQPSRQLRKSLWLSFTVGLRENPVPRIILNLLMPWDYFWALRLSRFKSELAQVLPEWLEVLFELEALSSLANLAYLNPGYIFPEIKLDVSDCVFETKALGHPLLRDAHRVCNDFEFQQCGNIALITGSNMSGKSTFLKTVGVNTCLAFAGGPVNAERFRTIPLRLFTSIKISDSLQDGVSLFYAEVKRLKILLDELDRKEEMPLLFLIDEIFKGTNNQERLIGSRSYIEALAGRNGIGLISTHDLELTKLADKIPDLSNYHFREDVQNGKMVFDYTIRTGPCPTTNALKIMKMEGLPVRE